MNNTLQTPTYWSVSDLNKLVERFLINKHEITVRYITYNLRGTFKTMTHFLAQLLLYSGVVDCKEFFLGEESTVNDFYRVAVTTLPYNNNSAWYEFYYNGDTGGPFDSSSIEEFYRGVDEEFEAMRLKELSMANGMSEELWESYSFDLRDQIVMEIDITLGSLLTYLITPHIAQFMDNETRRLVFDMAVNDNYIVFGPVREGYEFFD